MAPVKVAINGCGRIGPCSACRRSCVCCSFALTRDPGRLALRVLFEQPEHFELVHLNDLGSIDSTAYLIKRDSVHGSWQHETRVDGEFIVLSGAGRELRVPYSRAKEPALLASAYKAAGVALVLVSSFRRRPRRSHSRAARRSARACS